MTATFTPHPAPARAANPATAVPRQAFQLPSLVLPDVPQLATRATVAPAAQPADAPPVPAPTRAEVALPPDPTSTVPQPLAPAVVPQPTPAVPSLPHPAAPHQPAALQLPPRTHRDGVFGMAIGVGILVGLVAVVLALSSGMTEEIGGRGQGRVVAGS